MKAAILLVLFAVCLAQGIPFFDHPDSFTLNDAPEKAVCTWDQWQGKTVSLYPMHHVMAFSNISYSWKERKVYMEGVVLKRGDETTHHQKEEFEVLLDFPHRILYAIGGDNSCTCHDLSQKMTKACIPQQAECYGTSTIGGSLKVDTYHWHDKKGDDKHKGGISYTAVMSHKENVPVSVYYHSKKSSGSTSFFDVTEGIESPAVFHRPSQCTCEDDDKQDLPLGLDEFSDFSFEDIISLPFGYSE